MAPFPSQDYTKRKIDIKLDIRRHFGDTKVTINLRNKDQNKSFLRISLIASCLWKRKNGKKGERRLEEVTRCIYGRATTCDKIRALAPRISHE